MNERKGRQGGTQPDRRNDRRTYTEPDLAEPDLASLPFNPKRWRYVLNLLLDLHNWRHSTKHKGVSHKTMAERARFLHSLFEWLRENEKKQYKLDPRSLSGRHIDFILAHWQTEAKAGRMMPATIQTYFSFLKTFTGWIGKPKLMKPIGCYFDDPKLYERSYIATTDRSWKAAGVSVADRVREATRMDRHVAAALMLMAAFGLRFKEACMCRPREDIIERTSEAGVVTQCLDTHRGTKGGRERFVPIVTAVQREAIESAKSVAIRHGDSVSDPRLNLKQALRRTRYVMERLGITSREMGVTPHGLRHQYAGERYEELSGAAPPVAGGARIDKAADKGARLIVAEELGHGRTEITNADLGSSEKSDARPKSKGAPADSQMQDAN